MPPFLCPLLPVRRGGAWWPGPPLVQRAEAGGGDKPGARNCGVEESWLPAGDAHLGLAAEWAGAPALACGLAGQRRQVVLGEGLAPEIVTGLPLLGDLFLGVPGLGRKSQGTGCQDGEGQRARGWGGPTSSVFLGEAFQLGGFSMLWHQGLLNKNTDQAIPMPSASFWIRKPLWAAPGNRSGFQGDFQG